MYCTVCIFDKIDNGKSLHAVQYQYTELRLSTAGTFGALHLHTGSRQLSVSYSTEYS